MHELNKYIKQNINMIIITKIRISISIILLIREAKTLDPFLRKFRGRRSVKFGTDIHYKEE